MPVSARPRRGLVVARAAAVALVLGVVAAACGARTALNIPPPAAPDPECRVDADCPGWGDLCNPVVCRAPASDAGVGDAGADGGDAGSSVALRSGEGGVCLTLPPRDCDDGDECTADACDPDTGVCAHASRTADRD